MRSTIGTIRATLTRSLAASLLLATALSPDALAQSLEPCDRACLRNLVDSYLAALAAHDPARLDVAAGVSYTENGRAAALGEGLWRSAGTPHAYRDYALDPETGGAAALTALDESGGVTQLFVRLAIVGRRMAEIETIVVRPGEERWFAPENLARLSTLFATPVPPAERHSRAELVAAANAYFTAVQTEGTPAFVQAPFAPGMNRIENGLQTTNVTDSPRSDRHRWSAAEQLERAAYAGTVVSERRFPLVDTDHGVTVGIAVFRFAGENGPTLLLAEMFKVAGGQLREIRAVVRGIPKGTGAGWPAPP
jgi:hypothetical protein